MLSTGKYTEDIKEIILEVKHYLNLQKKYLAIDAAEKTTVILSAVTIAAICILLGAIILLFCTFALAYWIGDLLDSLPLGFLSMAIIVALLLLLFYCKRNAWVIQPFARMAAKLFVENNGEEEA
ncbi:MAG: phage holin family protein [Bacteroidaceae bacterium]|nr:phage holin family protein [Bacteroidaceae bacterium]